MPEITLPDIPDKFSLTPEFRLLAACSWIAPPTLEQDQAKRIASLCRAGVDWKVLLALVSRQGVSALAYTALCRHAGDQLPDAISDAMKAKHIQVAGRSLRQTTELVRISKLFAEQSLDMIVMKGVLLSQQLYGNPALRESTDIDLMVPLEDFDRADGLIRAAGYRCYAPGETLTERQKKFYMATGQNYEYCHESSGLKLEIHWRSYLWTQAQTDLLWERRQSLVWMGMSFNIWDDDALLLSLCYHGAHHEWCSLKWLSDVAQLLSQERPSGWNSLLVFAGQLGMRRVLAQSVLLVHWIYGIPLPRQLCELVHEEKRTLFLSTTAIRAMLMSPRELADAGKRLDSLRHSWYLRKLIPGLPYLELLKSVVIRDADFKEFPLPNCLFWMYIPLRPVFWLLRNFRNQERHNRL